MTVLFAITLFWSAWLLFSVEPMVGKMLLPVLGGVPAVWNACLVFFQGVLLAGYLFAYGTLRWLGPRRQVLAAAVLVAGAFFALPIAIDAGAASRFASLGPSAQALAVLAVGVALPFFALSAVAPTLQRWFSTTAAPRAKDPYFLYAASNLGSFGALLAYPVAIEPTLGLRAQAATMRWAYLGLAGLVALCGAVTWRGVAPATLAVQTAAIPWRRCAGWTLLAFVPSAYLVAVTEHLTTDVSPTPLLWTVPLAGYLLSFVLVFGAHARRVRQYTRRALPAVVVAVAYVLASTTRTPVVLVLALHLAGFFAVALLCHGALADDRPGPERLPEFYVWMSVGGLLGGVAVALVAPALLTRALEYPACLVLALVAGRDVRGAQIPWRREIGVAAVLCASVVVGGLAARWWDWPILPTLALVPILPLGLAYAWRANATRFAGAVGAVLAGALALPDPAGVVLSRDRNFFGTLTVSRDRSDRWRQITHGTTIHGMQSTSPLGRHGPRTYYSRSGPIGQAFDLLRESGAWSGPDKTQGAWSGPDPSQSEASPTSVAVVGLGAGTLAAYARPGEKWTFFEINPAVVRVAQDASRFSYLSDAFPRGERCTIVLGDARLELAHARGGYSLLVIDAFSSDAIPVHLVTEEAVRLYVSKVRPGGTIAWHVTNRSLDLCPVLAELAHAVGWTAYVRRDFVLSDADVEQGKAQSMWVAMAAGEGTLVALRQRGWQPLARRPGFVAWTDDRSSVLSILGAGR